MQIDLEFRAAASFGALLVLVREHLTHYYLVAGSGLMEVSEQAAREIDILRGFLEEASRDFLASGLTVASGVVAISRWSPRTMFLAELFVPEADDRSIRRLIARANYLVGVLRKLSQEHWIDEDGLRELEGFLADAVESLVVTDG
jgi:hypothetical protein